MRRSLPGTNKAGCYRAPQLPAPLRRRAEGPDGELGEPSSMQWWLSPGHGSWESQTKAGIRSSLVPG